MLSHGELFAGISGFGLGFERAGIKTIFAVEIDADCQKVLRHHHPDALLLPDVCECGKHNLPHVDILSFGSPCQDLSVAGKRAGLDGKRSGLFFEAIRITAELQPTFAVWENVPGALSSHDGRDFRAVLGAFRDIGARDIAWRIVDAQYFGVAQRRRRVFVVADFRGERAVQILFEPESVSGDSPPSREAGAGVARTFATSPDGSGAEVSVSPTADTRAKDGPRRNRGGVIALEDVSLCLKARGPTRQDPTHESYIIAHTLRGEGFDGSEDGTGRGVPMVADVCGSLTGGSGRRGWKMNAENAADGQLVVAAFTERTRKEGRTLEMQPDLAYALTNPGAGGRAHSRSILQQTAVRRLTPLECCRLQAFPDDWLDGLGLSDSAKYRMLGNAVCVNVAEWIGKRIAMVERGAL